MRKEQKHYHLDWSLVPGDAQRFENLVGAHLLKWVHFLQDTEGRDVDLRYFRDVDGREVDFVVVERRRPTHLVECKWADGPVDRGGSAISSSGSPRPRPGSSRRRAPRTS